MPLNRPSKLYFADALTLIHITLCSHRCVATPIGEGIAKLKTMLTAAQEAHPVQPEVSRHSHTFKHPYAKPEAATSAPPAAAAVAEAAADKQQAEVMQDDGSSDESPAPKRRARTASDLEAVAMNDVSALCYFSVAMCKCSWLCTA